MADDVTRRAFLKATAGTIVGVAIASSLAAVAPEATPELSPATNTELFYGLPPGSVALLGVRPLNVHLNVHTLEMTFSIQRDPGQEAFQRYCESFPAC